MDDWRKYKPTEEDIENTHKKDNMCVGLFDLLRDIDAIKQHIEGMINKMYDMPAWGVTYCGHCENNQLKVPIEHFGETSVQYECGTCGQITKQHIVKIYTNDEANEILKSWRIGIDGEPDN